MPFHHFSNQSILSCFQTVPEYLLSVRGGTVAEKVASAVVAAADPQRSKLGHLVGYGVLRGGLLSEENRRNWSTEMQ